jgi:hypothetical protein
MVKTDEMASETLYAGQDTFGKTAFNSGPIRFGPNFTLPTHFQRFLWL